MTKSTFAGVLLFAICIAGRPAEPLTLRATIPLAGVKGRFDHFAIDAKGGRIFVAALGNNTVELIHVRNAKRIQSIGGLSEATGICFMADQNRIGVANGRRGTFEIFDGGSFKKVKEIPDLDDADNVRFDAAHSLVLVGFASGAIGFVDSQKIEKIGEVKLKSHPESFQLERSGSRAFVNVPGTGEIAVIDRDKRTVIAEWPLHGYKANFPMALDESGKRVFVGCRSPARLLALDMDTGKINAEAEISGDTDDLFFDPKRNRVYVSCGEGFIDVISCVAGENLKRVGHIATRGGARTSFYSPEIDELYLAVPQRGGNPAEIRIYKPN